MQHSSHNITPKTPQVRFVTQNKSENWSNTQAGAGIHSLHSLIWLQRQGSKSQQLTWSQDVMKHILQIVSNFYLQTTNKRQK